jgi:antibiotic biosynthesis monooxygenase (ABM) superfamily enzyme
MLDFIRTNAKTVGWKRTAIVWLSVIAISSLFNSALNAYLHQAPQILKTMLVSTFMVPTILWLIMPTANKVLR